ncbi:MAG: hypothetical protein AAF802_15380, partial [Planctomycetota bacterium]
MRPIRFAALLLGVLSISSAFAQQRPTPVMEFASVLNSFDVYPNGRLDLDGSGEIATTVFLPKGAPVEAVLTKQGSNTPIHTQDFYVNHMTEVFAGLKTAGKYKQYIFNEPGDYVLTYRTGGRVMTQVPFRAYRETGGDEFAPKHAWYLDGPWNDWAYAFSGLRDKEDATLEFRMWAKRASFDGATITDRYNVELVKDGDVVAVSRTNHCGTQKWQKLEFEMSLPLSKGGRKFTVKQLGARDGQYHFVVKKNEKLHAVYRLVIKGSQPVLHPRQSVSYSPRHDYLVPRYAGLSAPGTDGKIAWMQKLSDSDAVAAANSGPKEVKGPTDAMKKQWTWLPTKLDPKRPFKLTVSDVETRTDTGFAVGEDLVVFGTGFPSGVKYLKAGENTAREIPQGETFSSTVFRVCGKKIILTKRTSVFVFDTETEKLTPIPTTEVCLYDGRESLIRSNGYLVATVNAATKVSDGNIIKVIDVSGENPVIIPIKNANYVDRDVVSVAVDAKNGHVAVASRQQKLVTAAKIAPLADQYLYDVAEYRGVASFDITIENNVVFYVDEDYKVRALDLNTTSPKAVTQEPIARSGNGFWVRKGRVVALTKEGKYGSRYPLVLSDSNDAPRTLPGTGTKIAGTSASLGMGGSAAIALDKTVFLAGTRRHSIGVGERLQVLGDHGWQPVIGSNGKPIWGCEVVTSMGFMALKVRNDDGKTVIGYATYGARLSLPGSPSTDTLTSSADSDSPTTTVSTFAPLKLGNDNPYITNDEKNATLLKAYLENEAQIGQTFAQSFGEETGRKRTVETVVQSMKSAGNEELVEDYFRMSKLVADEDRPKA